MSDDNYTHKEVSIWGKQVTISRYMVIEDYLARTRVIADLITISDDTGRCPKCDTKFHKERYHSLELTCRKCKAKWSFWGNLNPMPEGETRQEIMSVLE